MKQSDIKSINYRLWSVLMLTSFIPLIYSTTRIHFLGSIPSPWTFSIASQIAWLNVGYEVMNEALLIPLAFVLGQVIGDDKRFQHRIGFSLHIIMACYLVITVLVLLFAPSLVKMMQQQPQLFINTVAYIRLESIAIFLSSIYSFLSLVLILKNKTQILFRLLLLQMSLTILCDTLFVSQFSISLKMGVNGVAISNIAVNLVLAVVAVTYLKSERLEVKIKKSWREQTDWLKEWGSIGWKSGFESFIRNTAFIVMVLQLVNQVQQSGTFWLSNQFIWGWLLLPVIALGQLIKQDAAVNRGMPASCINIYLLITLGIAAFWFITIPIWESFISNVMGIEDPSTVIELVWTLLGFYIVFSINNVIDNYFYGIGRTDLMLYQSLIVNSLFYGGAFICYQLGLFVPTLQTIALMFGLGITIDAVVTWGLYLLLRKKLKTPKKNYS